MEPGRIAFRGHPVQDLIGNVSFPQMIWLLLRGDLPTEGQARLLEAALVSAVDHGPQAPSIAAARMAVTCGLPLNGAMASAVNFLDDVHGGAGEQAVELYSRIDASGDTAGEVARWRAEHGKYIPGFGHRFHKPVDPRAPRLMALVREPIPTSTGLMQVDVSSGFAIVSGTDLAESVLVRADAAMYADKRSKHGDTGSSRA